MDKLDIRKLLKTVVANGASDLHLVSNSAPQIRMDGSLVQLDLADLDGETIQEAAYSLMSEKQKKKFEDELEIDFAIELPDIGRFRANYYRAMGDVACAFRIIPLDVLSLDDLKAKPIFKEIIKREKGLILVTGPTGSGKSTTLAAMLNEINMYEQKHVITIEDPVEFVHKNKKCLFSQRNVGTDTNSFADAIKYAMREDPDIILIGEMRDAETIGAALTAAETGHLVFGTLHTNSAPQTINRIIDVFGGDEQPQIRAQLSTSLVAVISQMLVPRIPKGRVAAQEILITNPAISNLIREDKVHQMYSQMQLNQQQTGMSTQTQELVKFVQTKQISRNDALNIANRPDELMKQLGAI
ncbi:MAG: type IV pilus twitching motility protein PilT [Campylobacterota bacterium]|nr:type IV pilus twitching motility protein PilT [Campylobacterota bacterium]